MDQIRDELNIISRLKRIKSMRIETLRQSLEAEKRDYDELQKQERLAVEEADELLQESCRLPNLPVELITYIFALALNDLHVPVAFVA